MKKLPAGTKRQYSLTVAIVMIGASFIFFAILDRSALSYIVVDTLMLGACGICDIFWWSILGEMLDFSNNPPLMFGTGLSANILGIILGSFVAAAIRGIGEGSLTIMTNIAIGVVLVIIIILPLLYKQLSAILSDHAFAVAVREISEERKREAAEALLFPGEFTDREREITERLLRGKPCKLISEELFVSENTVKFHMKNIYSKLGVHNKTELLKALEEYGEKMQ
jgi:DNA-binding CsgD family transcriptional regulator